MRSIMIVAALAMPALAQTPDDKTRAEAIYADGQGLYAASNFAAAVDRFKAAYALDPDPAYLFNIAQAFRALHRCSDAATYYHRFLDQVASAPNLDKVHGYLAEVEACAHKDMPPPPAPVEQRSSPLVAIGVASGGILALGVGVGFAWHVTTLESRREGLCPSPCRWNQGLTDRANDLQKQGDAASTTALATLSVGVAAIATGVVLYWLGARAGHVEIAPRAGGAVVTTRLSF
jgi:tetratricopeptide (TPR) repeat protein